MGWWIQAPDGASLQAKETGLRWGDNPADVMDVAIRNIRSVFRHEMGREPLAGELRAGLNFSLSSLKDEEPLSKLDD